MWRPSSVVDAEPVTRAWLAGLPYGKPPAHALTTTSDMHFKPLSKQAACRGVRSPNPVLYTVSKPYLSAQYHTHDIYSRTMSVITAQEHTTKLQGLCTGAQFASLYARLATSPSKRIHTQHNRCCKTSDRIRPLSELLRLCSMLQSLALPAASTALPGSRRHTRPNAAAAILHLTKPTFGAAVTASGEGACGGRALLSPRTPAASSRKGHLWRRRRRKWRGRLRWRVAAVVLHLRQLCVHCAVGLRKGRALRRVCRHARVCKRLRSAQAAQHVWVCCQFGVVACSRLNCCGLSKRCVRGGGCQVAAAEHTAAPMGTRTVTGHQRAAACEKAAVPAAHHDVLVDVVWEQRPLVVVADRSEHLST